MSTPPLLGETEASEMLRQKMKIERIKKCGFLIKFLPHILTYCSYMEKYLYMQRNCANAAGQWP